MNGYSAFAVRSLPFLLRAFWTASSRLHGMGIENRKSALLRRQGTVSRFNKPLAGINKTRPESARYGSSRPSMTGEAVLARYFFHQIYGATRIEDREGECFPALESAILDAITSARHIMGNILMQGRPPIYGAIQICDHSGRVLEEVQFRDALREF